MNFKNTKAIVSGGASGLGLGLVQAIIAQGGQVAILDINDEQGLKLENELGSQVKFYKVDITKEDQVDQAVDAACALFSGLNLAVSCAGILGNGKLLGRNGPMALDFFKKVVDINLIGSFLLTRAAARIFVEQPENAQGERGVIVHTASIAAYEGQLGQVAYSATKSAIVGMILPLARELSRSGIRIMAIAPGMFGTPMLNNVTDDIKEKLCASVPFPARFGTVEEYAAMVDTIVGNQMLNGSVIRLDGAARLQ
ncbi:MAG: 3-hydroxyacyl-CoA dehydrogenase [Gammaproteobacteria bacterium CG22_combo_CG10-13_8_21_14_all_40_8]|nr:MAG: 3-hydroxyacyl-CoA dehydrogenase [Gammaproteobacteria bacterium CG22_combo_CG10-13_8_21_14_all_40_8]